MRVSDSGAAMELDEKSSGSSAPTVVHRCRFVEYQPDGIHCIERRRVDPEADAGEGPADDLVAVARSNGSVEIWNVTSGWFTERVIPGGEEVSVEAVVWRGDRLFTAGLHSMITEWSVSQLRVETIIDSFGGSVWCMAINGSGSIIAAGCEDGSIKLIDVSGGGMEFARSLDRQEGRILSVDWHVDEQTIVSGASDSTIRIWNATTGKCRLRILVQSERTEQALIWSVKALPDLSIVSGDSFGRTQIWDGKFGTLLQSFKQHEADVLVTLLSPDYKTIYASGVDNKVIQLKLVPGNEEGSRDSWVLTGRVREHTHDVRALTLASNNTIVSGGVDTNLIVYPSSTFGQTGSSHRKIPPFPQRQVLVLSASSKMLMYHCNRTIRLWQLGTSVGDATDVQVDVNASRKRVAQLPVASSPRLLVEMRTNTTDNVISSSISADGTCMAYSSLGGVRIFRIVDEDGLCKVKRMKELSETLRIAHNMAFSSDSTMLMIASTDEHLQIVNTRSAEVVATIKVPVHKSDRRAACLISISQDGQWVAVSYSSRFHIFNMDTFQHYGSTPLLGSAPTAAAFLPGTSKLVAACVNNQVVIYNVETRVQTPWSKNSGGNLPRRWASKQEKTVSIAFDPSKPTTAFFHDHAGVYIVDFSKPLPQRDAELLQIGGSKYSHKSKGQIRGKKMKAASKKKLPEPEDDARLNNFKNVKRYQPLLFLGFTESQQMVVVERPWLAVMQKLPPPLFRQKYGV